MSERPTPETDAAERMAFAQEYMVPTAFARKLERERDEARSALMEIEDRCVDCEDACDDIQKIREIAVKALEGAK